MAAKPVDGYVSHTEFEAIAPNRIVRLVPKRPLLTWIRRLFVSRVRRARYDTLRATLENKLARTAYADFVEKYLGS